MRLMEMEKDRNNIKKKRTFLDASPPTLFTCPDGQDISPPTSNLDSIGPTKIGTSLSLKFHQKPRRKPNKLVKNIDEYGVKSGGISGPKSARKTVPNAPKITQPCTECGKKFWSWKALFGHMRCHPERQWRGINPPPNFSSRNEASTSRTKKNSFFISEQDDQEVAASLLMLADGHGANASSAASDFFPRLESCNAVALMGCGDIDETAAGPSVNCSRFECLSCKKLFGSHQALGGHMASHKNARECFAITKIDGEEVDRVGELKLKDFGVEQGKMLMAFGHKCSICLRVFSSGQALGGHKRCHWEKEDEPSGITQEFNPFSFGKEGSLGLDLNWPASYSSGLTLDLRLGL